MNVIAELVEWFQSLPADFAFLLALPFAVGAAGLAAERYRGARRERARPSSPKAAGARDTGSRSHPRFDPR